MSTVRQDLLARLSPPGRSFRALLTAALALAAACSGDDGTAPLQEPVRLEIVSGDAQAGLPGDPLQQSLVVRATRDGVPVSVAVTFDPSAGAVNTRTRSTTSDGTAAVRWTLPAGALMLDDATVTATVQGGDQVLFTARLARPDETDLVISEDGLSVRLLAYPVGAFTEDSYLRRTFTDSAHFHVPDPAALGELAAFTPGRAPLLVSANWTTGPDTVRLHFESSVIRIPLTIWVVEPPFDHTMELVDIHLQGVRDTWEVQAGIGLGDVRIVDATEFPGADQFQQTLGSLCDPAVLTMIGTDAGRLNAYYLGQPSLGSGIHCGEGVMQIFPLAWERS